MQSLLSFGRYLRRNKLYWPCPNSPRCPYSPPVDGTYYVQSSRSFSRVLIFAHQAGKQFRAVFHFAHFINTRKVQTTIFFFSIPAMNQGTTIMELVFSSRRNSNQTSNGSPNASPKQQYKWRGGKYTL